MTETRPENAGDGRRGPLSSIKVLDVTANMSGPFATMILGDQGADVVKIEPLGGDAIRNLGTGTRGLGAYFANLNRSKRMIALDLSQAASVPIRDRLIDWADVVIHNYRPAAAHRLGIDADSVSVRRRDVVHVTITGFGAGGPNAGLPVYDHLIQAMSGFAARQARQDDPSPSMVRHGIADKLTGWAASQAVTAALVQRASTGVGSFVEVCMLDVAVATLWPDGMMNHTCLSPDRAFPDISSTFRLYETADGHVGLTVLTSRQLDTLADALEIGAEPGTVRRDFEATIDEVATRIRPRTTAAVVALLRRHDLPVAPVTHLDELHSVEQIIANGSVEQFQHPELGTIRQSAPAVRFGDERPSTLRPARRLGAHSREILAMLGFTDAELADALAAGLIAQPDDGADVGGVQ